MQNALKTPREKYKVNFYIKRAHNSVAKYTIVTVFINASAIFGLFIALLKTVYTVCNTDQINIQYVYIYVLIYTLPGFVPFAYKSSNTAKIDSHDM